MELIEGRDGLVDLSKGWQQFVLGAVLFYFVFSVMLGNSFLAFFEFGEFQQSIGFAFLSQNFVISLAYSFGAVFFIVMFIKHLDLASKNDLGFVLCLLSGTLLLVAFGTLYELAPIIQGVLQGTAQINPAGEMQPGAMPPIVSNIFKVFFSIAFYSVAGFFIGRLGNKVNKGNTSFKEVIVLLILPMSTLAALFTFGLVFEGIVTAVLASANLNLGGIISNIIFLVVFAGLSLKLFLTFAKEPEREKILSFTVLSLRIAIGAFGALFFLSLVSFSLLLTIDFGNTELLKIVSTIALWIVRTGFYGGMVLAVFHLKNLTKQVSNSGISIQFKQSA